MKFLSNILAKAGLIVDGTATLNSVANATTDTDRFIVIDNGVVKYRTGAELRSDIDAAIAAAAVPVGGSAGQILAKVDGTNYNTEWIDNYTTDVRQTVKAGENINKGQAVYISGADGTNVVISKASNTSDATSSKTLGLLAQNLSNNGQGFVITEGKLTGINTSTAQAGDPVWLGTNGNLLFGMANKPVAPAHLVYLGVVTRANQNNGEIFVHVVNGFELEELHDVLIGTYGTKDVLWRDTATNLWKNRDIFNLIGAASGSANGYLTSTDWNTFNNKQNALSLTTSGSSGAATLVGSTLNVPQYTLSGLGGVPSSRQLTINGTAFDLSANRSWSVGTVTSITAGTGITGGTITGSGTVAFDTTWGDARYQALLTNPVTGTGTTNFVPKFTGASTIGNSLIFDDGASVLINDTAPSSYRFDVNGTGRFRGDLTLWDDGANNGNSRALILRALGSTGNAQTGQIILDGFGVAGQDYLQLSASNIRLSPSSGSVLIAGTTPSISTVAASGFRLNANSTTNGFIFTQAYNQASGDLFAFFNNSNQKKVSADYSGIVTIANLAGTGTRMVVASSSGVLSAQAIPVGTVTSVGLTSSTNGITITNTPITSSGNLNIEIATASGSANGLLSSTDWTTFNNKQNTISLTTSGSSGAATLVGATINIPQYQAAGNYITDLTGEATASGPGAASVTLSTSAVTGKILTGLNVTGGSVTATDSILTAFGKLQNQVNGLAGGVTYQGAWDASTNTPTLTSSTGTKGYYYVVSVPGSTNLNGVTDWKLGDWAIFNGTSWEKVDNTDAVVSVNGFTGAVSLTSSNITEGTNLYYTNARARQALSLTTSGSSGAATYDNSTGALNVPQYTLSGLGGVPTTRTLTINGTAFDLSADRSWSVGTVTSVGLSSATSGVTIGSTPVTGSGTITLAIATASGSQNGLLSSTDWTTFNNKQNALTNPVTGTGTTNFLPKFTGTSTIGNSQVFDDGTNVGIGTNAPTSKLTVLGDAIRYAPVSIAWGHAVLVIKDDGSNGTLDIASEIIGYANAASDPITFRVSNVSAGRFEAMRITSGGNVGIGTTSPQNRLHVSFQNDFDGLRIENSNRGHNYLLTTAGSSAEFFSIYDVDNSQFLYQVSNDNGHGFLTGGVARMTITSGGNVGIGTTTPQTALDLRGQMSVGFNAARTAGTALVITGATDNTTDVSIGTNTFGSGVSILFQNGGSTRMTLTSSGNLGLGVTPSAWSGGGLALQVSKASLWSFNGNNTYLGNNYFLNSSTQRVYIGNGFATEYAQINGEHIWYNASNNTSGAGAAISFTQAMTLDASGRLGIGTPTPNAPLTVVGSGVTARFQTGSANDGRVEFAYNTTDVGYIAVPSSNEFSIWARTNNALLFGAGNTERMRITSGGNVLVGTQTDNGQRMQIAGGASTALRLDANSGVAALNIGAGATLSVDAAGVGGGRFLITSGGNVGIGTASPNLLTWNRAVTINTATGNSALELSIGDAAQAYFAADASDIFLASFANKNLKLRTNNADRMTITAAGNIGIGTTTPVSLLNVYGDTNLIHLQNSTTGSSGADGSRINLSGSDLQIINRESANMIFYTADTERMRITSGGNVGIGETNIATSFRLQVRGGLPALFHNDSTANSPTYGGTIFYRPTNTSNNGVGIAFNLNNSANASAEYGYIGGLIESATAGAENGSIIFAPQSGSARTERMRITSGGNVGIGTTTPSGSGWDESATVLHVFKNTTNGGLLKLESSNTAAILNAGNDQLAIFTTTDDPIRLGTNGSERMRITSGGNVGIGTNTPAAYSGYSNLAINGSTGGNIDFLSNNTFVGGISNTSTVFSIFSASILRFGSNSTEQMRITTGGNVGIGTSSPNATLHVNGTIRTQDPTGATAHSWKLGKAYAGAPTTPTITIEVEINGSIYQIGASTV